jgi:hypothetical protein
MQRADFSNLAKLDLSKWLSRAEVESRQLEKLRQLLQIATVPGTKSASV